MNDGINLLESKRHPFTLRFQSDQLEQEFADSIYPVDFSFARVGMLLAIFMYATFAILDLWIVPDYAHITWAIRFTVTLIFALVFGFSFTRYFRETYQYVMLVSALIGGGGLVGMIYFIPEVHGYLYYPALIIAFVFFYTMLGMRFINAFYANVAMVVMYNVVVIAHKDIPIYMLVNNNYFLVGATVVTAAAGYIIEQQRRISFLKSLVVEELRQQADEANIAKSRFFASMSHELRTPLNAIIGYSEMLLEDEKSARNPTKTQDLAAIEMAGRHLLRLINDVLDLAKIESGKIELVPERILIQELVTRILATVSPLAAGNDNQVKLDIDNAPESIIQDAMRLEQILINLLSNACKFTEHGEITFSIRSQGEMVLFSIRDTGIGMNEAQLQNLFNEYTQADAKITRDYGGTGLGLAISKQFVDLLGGTISVNSVVGSGSRFDVQLPANTVAKV